MKPMMSNGEIEIIDSLIEECKPKFCLEFGSGGSTIYFPKEHPDINWLAIEHNGNWIKKIADNLPDNATVIWTPDNEWYVDSVKHSRIFDFILIDGLHRERCLEITMGIISKNGIILLHDSGREEYQDFIEKYKGEKLSEGEKPEGKHFAHRGLTMFRKYK